MSIGTIFSHPERPTDPNWAILGDFDTGKDKLLPAHVQWLEDHAIPTLRNGGWIFVRGFASHLGSDASNQDLSNRRAHQVASFLLDHPSVPVDHITAVDAVGETRSTGGNRDNSANWRAVEVTLTPQPRVVTLPTLRIEGRRWEIVFTELAPSHSNWTLAGRSDTPVGSPGEGGAAAVQFASQSLNAWLLNRNITQQLLQQIPTVRRALGDDTRGGVLVVAWVVVTRHGEMEGSTLHSLSSESFVFAEPNQAIADFNLRPMLRPGIPSRLQRVERRFFWAHWRVRR